MRLTLNDLYTRYSARLAAHVAGVLSPADADPLADTDDITQEVWVLAAQLLVLPGPDDAWLVLQGLANRVTAQHLGSAYRAREIPSGIEAPAARGLPRPTAFSPNVRLVIGTPSAPAVACTARLAS